MNTKEIVKELASNRKLTIAEVERKAGISNGTIGKFGKQKPSVDTLNKLADFFNVSVDYLLGREDESRFNDDLVFYRMNLDGLSEEEIAEVKRQIEIAEEIAIRSIRNKK